MKSVGEMQVVILAGGLGTRLRPFTETIPKPMTEICGKPFLEYQLNHLKNSGTKKVLICLGYLGEKVQEYFGNGNDFDLDIDYSYERELLGTAGAIKNAGHLIKTNPFMVMNGDTYTKVDLETILSSHLKNNPLITMVVTDSTNPAEQELVEMEENKISAFYKRDTPRHKSFLEKTSNPLINAGVYIIDKKILEFIPRMENYSLEREIFPQLIRNINGVMYKGYIKDIANIQFCKELEQDILEGRIK
jgi:NDP-sugar pyrophosphorylase family protein